MNESPSLWKQAYDKLDVELVKKYEKLLLEEFPTSSFLTQAAAHML